MEKGKNKWVAAPVARIGFAQMATIRFLECSGPSTKTTTKLEWGSNSLQMTEITYGKAKQQPKSYERTSKIKKEDKKSGGYQRCTVTEKVSAGKRHVEKGTGKVGVKNECKKSSTVKIGNKSGYTEVHTEERVRKVKFGAKNKCCTCKNNLISYK